MARDYTRVVEALFAKAEDPSATEEERSALQDKALAFMAEHGINDAMLADAGKVKDEIISKSLNFPNPYGAVKSRLYSAIARSFRCTVIQLRGKQGHRIFGYRSDVEKTDDLYDYILKYGVWSLNQAMEDRNPFEALRTFTISFWDGFMTAVYNRLKAMNAQENAKANSSNTGTELVLVKRERAVSTEVRKEYPLLTTTKRYGNGGSGYGAGTSAGNSMGLGRGGQVGGRKAISG